jgi:phage terminase small subunit
MTERDPRITEDKVLNELAKLGFSNLKNYVRLDSDGNPIVDLSETTEEQFAAVKEIKYRRIRLRGEDDDDGGIAEDVGIKLYDKQAALVNIGKELGMFAKKIELDANINLADRMRNARKRLDASRGDPESLD